MKTNKYLKPIIKYLKDKIDSNILDEVTTTSYREYKALVEKYKNDSKVLKKQTLGNMFPVIAIYKSLISSNVEQEKALELLDGYKTKESLKKAKSTSGLFKLFGLYKLYPTIFKKVTLKSFSKDIGFDPHFIEASKTRCKFDMKKCVFCDRCKEEGVFELVTVFCNTDITFNTNLHKNIIWHRDGTLAEGKECCDFDVMLKK